MNSFRSVQRLARMARRTAPAVPSCTTAMTGNPMPRAENEIKPLSRNEGSHPTGVVGHRDSMQVDNAPPETGKSGVSRSNDEVSGARSETLARKENPGGILGKPPVSPGQGNPVASDTHTQLPHERDQSVGDDSTGGLDEGAAGEEQIRLGKRAAADLAQGQVDTDMRATPGLDAERRASMTRPQRQPLDSFKRQKTR